MSVSGTLKYSVVVDEVKSPTTNAGPSLTKHSAKETVILADGVTAGKFDKVFSQSEAPLAGVTDIDLYGGLTDAYGAAFNCVGILFYYIKNHSTTATLTVGGDATQPCPLFIDGNETIGPLGFRMGYFGNSASEWGPIGAGSADILQLTPSASLSYTLILGCRTS